MLGMASGGLWWLVAHADRVGLATDLPLSITATCVYAALTVLVAVRASSNPLQAPASSPPY